MATTRRWRCFLDIEMGGGHGGRIVVELFNDICPKTCENFRALCTGEMGLGKTSNKPLHYKGTIFHRVIMGFMVQGGDISSSSGRGGESIYGGLFEDENLELIHDKPFLLSMANRGPNSNGSQFFMTTVAAPHLDKRNVVFGQVITGQNIISVMENVPVDRVSRPLTDIKIVKCGQLVLNTKQKKKKKDVKADRSHEPSTSDSSDTSSDKNSTVKEQKKKKKKKKKTDDEESEDLQEEETHPLVSLTSINAEDIPSVPVNRLMRGTAPQYDKNRDDRKDRAKPQDRERSRDRDRDRSYAGSRVYTRGVTKSGRNIKGRGVFRYRTPSRSRSRSVTPPHWKKAQSRTIKLAEFKQKTKEQIQYAEELKRRQQARIERHSSLKDSKYRENSQGLNADSRVSQDKIDGTPASQTTGHTHTGYVSNQKSSQDSGVVISSSHTQNNEVSDLEEGETRDDVILPAVVCNDSQESEDLQDKQRSANGVIRVDSSLKQHGSKEDLSSKRRSHSSEREKNQLEEESSELPMQTSVKKELDHTPPRDFQSEELKGNVNKEDNKIEDGKKEEEKKWENIMEEKQQREMKRKKAIETERKLLEQKNKEKLKEISRKKQQEEIKKLPKKSRRRASSASSSRSSSSNSSPKRHRITKVDARIHRQPESRGPKSTVARRSRSNSNSSDSSSKGRRRTMPQSDVRRRIQGREPPTSRSQHASSRPRRSRSRSPSRHKRHYR